MVWLVIDHSWDIGIGNVLSISVVRYQDARALHLIRLCIKALEASSPVTALQLETPVAKDLLARWDTQPVLLLQQPLILQRPGPLQH